MLFVTNVPGFCFGSDDEGTLKIIRQCEMPCSGLEPKDAESFKNSEDPRHKHVVNTIKHQIKGFLSAPGSTESGLTLYNVKTGEVLAYYTREDLGL